MDRPPIDEQITFFYTRDLPATARFYEEVMGLPLEIDQGTCRIYRVTGSALVGFCSRDDLPEKPLGPGKPYVLFTIVTQDVDGWYERLREQGVPFEKKPETNRTYGIYHCFAIDPNGYWIEIQRFLNR
ncbi:MAG: VOC family protein [Planctomycetota bacterium]|jgi:catechol 2,3-dioxygenase-like lactoylglutathione lyase family enzyme